MNKDKTFIGQPILGQIIKLIPKQLINSAVQKHYCNKYYKKLPSRTHLIRVCSVTKKSSNINTFKTFSINHRQDKQLQNVSKNITLLCLKIRFTEFAKVWLLRPIFFLKYTIETKLFFSKNLILFKTKKPFVIKQTAF